MEGLGVNKTAPWLVAYAFSLLVGATLGGLSGPYGASVMVASMIVLYAIALSLYPGSRLLFLSAALGAHLAAVASYYSNPVPLPLFVLERSAEGYSLNIDIVQVIIAYEAVSFLRQRRQVVDEVFPEQGKTLKSPADQ